MNIYTCILQEQVNVATR